MLPVPSFSTLFFQLILKVKIIFFFKLTLVIGCVLFRVIWAFDETIFAISDIPATITKWVFSRDEIVPTKLSF